MRPPDPEVTVRCAPALQLGDVTGASLACRHPLADPLQPAFEPAIDAVGSGGRGQPAIDRGSQIDALRGQRPDRLEHVPRVALATERRTAQVEAPDVAPHRCFESSQHANDRINQRGRKLQTPRPQRQRQLEQVPVREPPAAASLLRVLSVRLHHTFFAQPALRPPRTLNGSINVPIHVAQHVTGFDTARIQGDLRKEETDGDSRHVARAGRSVSGRRGLLGVPEAGALAPGVRLSAMGEPARCSSSATSASAATRRRGRCCTSSAPGSLDVRLLRRDHTGDHDHVPASQRAQLESALDGKRAALHRGCRASVVRAHALLERPLTPRMRRHPRAHQARPRVDVEAEA